MTDFQKIERIFSELLEKPSSILKADECAEVRGFIDVGEFYPNVQCRNIGEYLDVGECMFVIETDPEPLGRSRTIDRERGKSWPGES
jgi:hypothetical protein